MTQFALDTSSKVGRLLHECDPARRRFLALEAEHQRNFAALIGRNNRLNELRETKADIERQRATVQAELARFSHAETVIGEDADGKETHKPHPMIAESDSKLEAIREKIALAEAEFAPKLQFPEVEDYLHRYPLPKLNPATIPTAPTPKAGQTLLDLFNAEVKKLQKLRKERRAAWEAYPDRETVFDRIDRAIARHANGPTLGGLVRQSYETPEGRKVDIRDPELLVPQIRIDEGLVGGVVRAPDAFGMICALWPDLVRDHLRAEYDRDFANVVTMPLKAKFDLLAELAAKIVTQWRVVEEVYLAANEGGFRVNRIAETPAEVMLGIESYK